MGGRWMKSLVCSFTINSCDNKKVLCVQHSPQSQQNPTVSGLSVYLGDTRVTGEMSVNGVATTCECAKGTADREQSVWMAPARSTVYS